MSIIICVLALPVLVLFLFLFYKKSNEHFKNALVSLEKDRERREYVLSKTHIDHVYAVDGFELDFEQLENEGKILKDSKIKKGIIGCYLSHVHMLQIALDSKDLLLVFEDDIDIPDDFYKNLDIVLEKAPKDFELLFLSYNYNEPYDYKNVNLVFGLQAYVINGKNITQDKIDSLFPIQKPIDIILPTVFKKSYIVIPKIANLSKFAEYSNTERV